MPLTSIAAEGLSKTFGRSTVLTDVGFEIGADGIGVALWETMRGFQYGETATIMLVIIVAVTALDMASQTLRKRFI